MYLGEERNLPDPDRRRARRKQRAYLTEWVDTLAGIRRAGGGDGHLMAQAASRCCRASPGSRPGLPRAAVEAPLAAAAAPSALELGT